VPLGTWRWLRVAGDLLAGVTALALAFAFRLLFPEPFTPSVLLVDFVVFFATAVPFVGLTQNLLLYLFGFYELPHPQQAPERLRRLVTAVLTQTLVFASVYFLASRNFPRSVLLLFALFNFVLLLTARALLDRLALPPLRRVAIVGAGTAAHELAAHVASYPWYGLEIVGWVAAPSEPAGGTGPGVALGTIDDLPRRIVEGTIDEIVLIGESATWQTRLLEKVVTEGGGKGGILLLPGPFESLLGRMHYRSLHDLPLIEVLEEDELLGDRRSKRLFDLTVASGLLLLSLPLFALCAALVKLSSAGPIFYTQQRVGRRRRPFTLWKLRTMRVDAETGPEEVLATPNDPRLTPLGGLLRALRLDELPQLLNVLDGSMSMVGPRPERPGFVRRYLGEVPGYAARFALRPGITGLAQVNGDYHTSPENKLRYDLAYLANWSLWLDLSILVRTVRTVLTSRGT
jgi:exopolysaccharide biosynthesis polyprenyl glycosylphosphotransferase